MFAAEIAQCIRTALLTSDKPAVYYALKSWANEMIVRQMSSRVEPELLEIEEVLELAAEWIVAHGSIGGR